MSDNQNRPFEGYEALESPLKPCPFCGGNNVQPDSVGFRYFGKCNDCGAEGPEAYPGMVPGKNVVKEAIKAWNTRASE